MKDLILTLRLIYRKFTKVSQLNAKATAKSLRGGAINEMMQHPAVHSMSIVTDRSGHSVFEPRYENNRAYEYNEASDIQITIGGLALAGSANPRTVVCGPQLDLIITDENREVVFRFMKRLFKTFANSRFENELLEFSKMCLATHLCDIANGLYPPSGKLFGETMNAAAEEKIHWETVKGWGRFISEDFDGRKAAVNPNSTWNEQVSDIVLHQREASVTHLKKLHHIVTQNKELLDHNKLLQGKVDKLASNFEQIVHMFKAIEEAQISRSPVRKRRNLSLEENCVSSNTVEATNPIDVVHEGSNPISTFLSQDPTDAIESIMTTQTTTGIVSYTVNRKDLLEEYMANNAIHQFQTAGTKVCST